MFRTAKAVLALSEVERRDEAVADCKQLVWALLGTESRAIVLAEPRGTRFQAHCQNLVMGPRRLVARTLWQRVGASTERATSSVLGC